MDGRTTEDKADRALRPATFATFLGQETSKHMLRVSVTAARGRGEPLDHVLLAGPPGLGKTTLASIIACEMGSRLVTVNAPTVRTKGDMAGLLLQLRRGDLLFLDEIHSLHPKVEEILYSAMEDMRLEVVAGEGAMGSAVTLELEPFTLIGATTREGMLSQPLRDRFGIAVQMRPYSVEELAEIVSGNASKLGVSIDPAAAACVARRSRGTPRIANRLLRRSRDFAHHYGLGRVDVRTVESACNAMGIDDLGLDAVSQGYLRTLSGRDVPAGIDTLCGLTGQGRDTLEEAVEPYLMRLGLVEKTPKGRVITAAGRAHVRTIH